MNPPNGVSRDGQSGFAVDGARNDSGAGGFGYFKGFTGQKGFVHDAIAFGDSSIYRADVVRENDEGISYCDVV